MNDAAPVDIALPTPSERRPGAPGGSDYAALLSLVREAGLLQRCLPFYWTLFGILMVASGTVVTVMAMVGDSWWQLPLAALAGLLMAQFGFLAHEASHREIFAGGRANDRAGLFLGAAIVGVSFSWWKTGHVRHHADPNTLSKDPSVRRGAFAFTAEDAAATRGITAWYTRRQAWFLFPLLLLAGVNMQVQSVGAVIRAARTDGRWREASVLIGRDLAYLTVVYLCLPPGKATALVAVQVAVFGIATASAFIPNHVGMPMLPAGSRAGFLLRQIITSRNIGGGAPITALMGGLNFQIEHHLFPSMPRPHLAAASRLVRAYCRDHGISYTVTSLPTAYADVLRYLDAVGVSALREARCPTAAVFGR
jgi:fatty acid desaturase